MEKKLLGTFVALSALLFLGAGCSSAATSDTSASLNNTNTAQTDEVKSGDAMKHEDAMMKEGDTQNHDAMMEGDHMMTTGTDSMMHDDKMPASSTDAMKKDATTTKTVSPTPPEKKVVAAPQLGIYEDYTPAKLALAKTGKVVIFFKASWCPECKAVDADITAHLSAIPKNLAILKVDYDTSAEMKKQYGVTIQHTFVQVDENGKLIKKWIGSPTLADITSKVQ